ncbi:hypothetical protein WBG78_11590 [Chryseolinea sp. T2]|uniref:NHL domain-containing protein n=1 Tax=Chryseolinea sp. T2 TaxID=3129255 RepID=UPI003076967C
MNDTGNYIRLVKANPAAIKRESSRARINRHNRLIFVAAILLTTVLVALMSACEGDNEADESAGEGEIETIVGAGGVFDYSGDGGVATDARLGYITGVALNGQGDLFVVDGAANVLRKVNVSDKKISTVAGTFLGFNSADPTPHAGDGSAASQAHLNVPFGIAISNNNDIYIADAGNQVVRRIDATTGKIEVFAGNYNQPLGYTGDGAVATSASLHTPYDVAIDKSGNVFIADKDNHAIRRVTAGSGVINTVAGGGPLKKGYAGDNGPATQAMLNTPQGIAVAANGDLYIADAGNNVIRRVESGSGKINTFAGTGTAGYSGDNALATAAQLSSPTRICIDASGNILIADHGNHVIRKVDPSGIITTIAGTGIPGFSGDGGLALGAQLSSPFGVAVDSHGNLVVTDNGNSVVRMIIR